MSVLTALTSRLCHVSISVLAAVVVATAVTTQVAIPPAVRQARLTDAVVHYVGSHPPTDEIVRQMDLEWLRAFYGKVVAHVDRLMAIGAAIFAVAGAVAFIGFGRAVRPGLLRLTEAEPVSSTKSSPDLDRWDRPTWLTAAVVSLVAVGIHWHTYTSAIRYDEDQASLGAGYGWWEWANNLAGWQVHVAAMFTIRLVTAVFGIHPWAVRLPALLASSLAAGGLAGMMARRFSLMSAMVATAVVFSVPLWAEQTTLARGYGLSFSAGVMLVIAVTRLFDEKDRPRTFSVFLLMTGVFVGCLAHFFFVFMVLGLLVVVLRPQPVSRDVRRAVAFAIFIALIVPGISLALGLPAIVVQSSAVADAGLAAVWQRFEFELMFRSPPPVGTLAAAAAVTVIVAAFAMMPKRARTAALLTLLCSVAVPVVMKPVYLYPRFFLHLVPLIAAVVGWGFGRTRATHGRWLHPAVPGATALLVCGGLLMASPPWRQPVFVDLLAASQVSAEETARFGNAFGLERDLVPGVRFYLPDLRPRIVQLDFVPPDVDRMLVGVPERTLPPGVMEHFTVVRQWPGSEHTVYLLQRKKR